MEILNQIDYFEGIKFEEFVGELLYKNGYKNVEVTKGSGDFGADVIAEKDGNKYAFQCKRFNSTIGPKPIGEVLRGMHKYNCNKGVVITNNYFTKQAIREGEICDIELWDRDKLSILIENDKIELTKKNKNAFKPIKMKEDEEYMKLEENENIELDSYEAIDEFIKTENEISNKNCISKDRECEELIAGYYEVNEDIEEGKYIIEAILGSGVLQVEDKNKNLKVNECIGFNTPYFIQKYNNLKLKSGDIIQIQGTVILKFKSIS